MTSEDKKSMSSDGSLVESEKYGCSSWRPSCLQTLNSARWFLVFACVSSFAHTMGLTLIAVTTSTLETRYGLSSSQMGLVTSIYELAGIFMLILIGVLANYANKPRWLSWGMVSVSIACIIYVLPQVVSDVYVYEQYVEGEEHWCVLNGTNRTDVCAAGGTGDQTAVLAYFYTSAVFFAMGSVPMYIYSIAYVDDSVHYTKGALYTSIFISMACFGPVLAFVLGGGMLFVYVDFARVDMDTVSITPEDPRWVGAWWVGFLFAALIALADVIPLMGFPRNPPYKKFDIDVQKDLAMSRQNSTAVLDPSKQENDFMTTAHLSLNKTMKTLPQYIKQIYTNATYVLLSLSGISDGFLITGFTAFGPKYLETMFSLTPGTAGALFGLTVLPGAVGGTVAGGWLIRKKRLSPLQMIKTIFINNLVIMLFGFIFLLRCQAPPFYGITTGSDLACSASQACNCTTDIYDPMCGSDGVTYFSSCHAGCLTANLEEETYGNCSCVGGGYGNTSGHVTSGVCPAPECYTLIPFLILFLVPMFFLFIGLVSHSQAVLRVVSVEQRTLALSLDWGLARLLGTVPGPLVFAAILDLSCVLWDVQCGETGECLYYDNKMMGLYMLAVCAIAKGPACVFAGLSFFIYKRKLAREAGTKIAYIDDITVTVPGSDVTNGDAKHSDDSLHKTANGLARDNVNDDVNKYVNTGFESTDL